MFKSYLLFILALLLSCNACFAKDETIEIKHADSLQADNKQIVIMGNILIEYNDALIEAPEGIIEIDENGEQTKAIFSKRAKLKLKDRRLEADKIIFSIKNKVIYAEGNTLSELRDKKNIPIIITCDYQELYWSGENANARGNLITTYEDTKVTSDEVTIIYKNKKPEKAVFIGKEGFAYLEQPTNHTKAKELIFDINTHNLLANGDVTSTVWTDEKKSKAEQDPVNLNTDELFIDNDSGTIIAKSKKNKVNLSYQLTKGESNEATLFRDKISKKPEQIVFRGMADVSQEDKQIQSEEVVFNFKDKKLTSNTKTNIRPKTLIYKRK